MSKKHFESDSWSEWTCATCGCSHDDPDSIKATTCAKGHTNYLGPVEGRSRRAYKSAYLRRKDIREHQSLMTLMSAAFAKVKERTQNH